MENCLVTKLKGVVNNDSLPKLGKMKVGSLCKISSNWQAMFVEDTTIKCLNGTFNSTGTSEKTAAANTTFYSSGITLNDPNGTIAELEIPKYPSSWRFNRYIAGLTDGTIDASFLEYADGLQDISFSALSGAHAVIKNFKIEYMAHMAFNYYVNPNSTQIAITACDFEKPLDVTDMHLYVPSSTTIISLPHSTNIVGTFDGLGSCTSIAELTPPLSAGASLDLVNFVTNARSAGKTTGSVNIHWPNSIVIKANGTVIIPTSQQDSILEWTADSITFQGNPIS